MNKHALYRGLIMGGIYALVLCHPPSYFTAIVIFTAFSLLLEVLRIGLRRWLERSEFNHGVLIPFLLAVAISLVIWMFHWSTGDIVFKIFRYSEPDPLGLGLFMLIFTPLVGIGVLVAEGVRANREFKTENGNAAGAANSRLTGRRPMRKSE